MKLLSVKDLSRIISMPESTVNRWTAEFKLFIPKTKKQDKMFYLPEAASVLLSIKTYYDAGYSKSDIMKFLADKSLPSEANDAAKVNQTEEAKSLYEKNFVTMMQTIGKVVANVADQDRLLQTVKEQQAKQDQRLNTIEKQAVEIDDLKQEIKQIKHELTSPDMYEDDKLAFSQLFRHGGSCRLANFVG